MFDAHRHDFIPERPHPAAKKIMSLRQNDLIAIEKDGVFREIVRVVKFGENGQITIAAHKEVGPLKERDVKPNDLDPFKYSSPTAGGLKRSEEHRFELQSLMRITYAVLFLYYKTLFRIYQDLLTCPFPK